jgi:hypothetical protein
MEGIFMSIRSQGETFYNLGVRNRCDFIVEYIHLCAAASNPIRKRVYKDPGVPPRHIPLTLIVKYICYYS